MAVSVPTWHATSKGRPNRSEFQPKNVRASIRCAELDTGRNSVSPCTTPSSAASSSSPTQGSRQETRTLRPPLRGRSATASSTGTAARPAGALRPLRMIAMAAAMKMVE